MLLSMIFAIMFIIIAYGYLIWSYFYPEESMLLLNRWVYKKEPEFSDTAIAYTKFESIFGIFILTMIIVGTLSDSQFLNFFLLIVLFSYVIFKVLKTK
ncbi:ammonia channel protein AmtB [Texcoconibacillus texcoconensis]|uniref:Ammonia channel protein AmtB n=1 Tax=Texcoconibacillus texcoconensis TaxID=1095777 RepID=A0A840QKA8_9BACI|nr:ammonia channel protein AmtB [Texcoconibacillus texcoconensis]